jgi:hypothetical protein
MAGLSVCSAGKATGSAPAYRSDRGCLSSDRLHSRQSRGAGVTATGSVSTVDAGGVDRVQHRPAAGLPTGHELELLSHNYVILGLVLEKVTGAMVTGVLTAASIRGL